MDNNKNTSRIGIIICLLLLTQSVFSQQIKIISATSQGWAGGFSYQTGTNYCIYLQIIRTKEPIVLDSLWLDGYCRDLSKYNPGKKHKLDTFYINVQEKLIFNKMIPSDNLCYDATKKGVVISYKQNEKQILLNVTPYIRELYYLHMP